MSRLIWWGPEPGEPTWNMALDAAMLDAVESDASKVLLRFYHWHPPAVSLGYHQRVEDAVAASTCRRLRIPVVRRVTGGRAVLHQHELTYALAAPHRSIPCLDGRGVLGGYAVLSRALVHGLRRFGIPAEWRGGSPDDPGPRKGHPSCFVQPGSHEILLGGKKLIGSAQLRRPKGLLQHGSLLLDREVALWRRVLSGREGDPAEGSTSLAEAGFDPPLLPLAAAIARALGEGLGLAVRTEAPGARLLERAGERLRPAEVAV